MSSDEAGLRQERPKIMQIIAEYRPEDVWNADKFGIFLDNLSTGTIISHKNDKTRITCLAC